MKYFRIFLETHLSFCNKHIKNVFVFIDGTLIILFKKPISIQVC